MLQVTSNQVRCTSPTPSASSQIPPPPPPPYVWKPSDGAVLSLAAVEGDWVVVVSGGRRLHLLYMDPGSATGEGISERYSGEVCASQMSSLSLLVLPNPDGEEEPYSRGHKGHSAEEDICIAVGLWSENRLLLLSLSDLLDKRDFMSVPPAAVALEFRGETPRSAAVMRPSPLPHFSPVMNAPLASLLATIGPHPSSAATSAPPLLLVGTNGGLVLIWELIKRSPDTSGALGQSEGCLGRTWKVKGGAPSQVRVSNVAVELIEMSGGIYAHSGSDAIFRWPTRASNPLSMAVENHSLHPSDTTSASACSHLALEVCRIHGGSGLRAVCPVTTASMPPGSMAWVGREGRLMFGRLDPELKLRWTTAYIGESFGILHAYDYGGTLLLDRGTFHHAECNMHKLHFVQLIFKSKLKL